MNSRFWKRNIFETALSWHHMDPVKARFYHNRDQGVKSSLERSNQIARSHDQFQLSVSQRLNDSFRRRLTLSLWNTNASPSERETTERHFFGTLPGNWDTHASGHPSKWIIRDQGGSLNKSLLPIFPALCNLKPPNHVCTMGITPFVQARQLISAQKGKISKMTSRTSKTLKDD